MDHGGRPNQIRRLRLISNHFIRPLFKTNQFFFELSKLTSLIQRESATPTENHSSKGRTLKERPMLKLLPYGSLFERATHMGYFKKKIQKSENIISKGDPYYLYYNIL